MPPHPASARSSRPQPNRSGRREPSLACSWCEPSARFRTEQMYAPYLTVSQSALGAYGLNIVGLEGAEAWMQALPHSSPPLRVETAREAAENLQRSTLDGTAADLRLIGGGRLRMRRDDERAVFSFPELPPDEDLLHPYLAPAAALAHLWAGREALHGGAFATSAGAVALFADNEGGKSTTLAWLPTQHRLPVISDDLVVLRRGAGVL